MTYCKDLQLLAIHGESVVTGDWMYYCHVFHHVTSGICGGFTVSSDGGPSISGMEWEQITMIPHDGHM